MYIYSKIFILHAYIVRLESNMSCELGEASLHFPQVSVWPFYFDS